MQTELTIDFLKRLAKGLANQFGSDCEIAIHDLKSDDSESTIIAIENGHVTNRKVGDGPSQVVLEALQHNHVVEDHLNYWTTTDDGRILRSTTIYIKDDEGEVIGVFSINYDITNLVMAESTLKNIINRKLTEETKPQKITKDVEGLLDELIERSVEIIGKPVAMMTKDDKKRAMQFLNDAGAFLITKSGDKVSEYFGISKYTLYNYVDIKSNKN
ncbi:MAG: transcriptional regulator [Cellulosilyticaceae bacterium]